MCKPTVISSDIGKAGLRVPPGSASQFSFDSVNLSSLLPGYVNMHEKTLVLHVLIYDNIFWFEIVFTMHR